MGFKLLKDGVSVINLEWESFLDIRISFISKLFRSITLVHRAQPMALT